MATSQITSSYEGAWISTQAPFQDIFPQNIVCLNEAIIVTLLLKSHAYASECFVCLVSILE